PNPIPSSGSRLYARDRPHARARSRPSAPPTRLALGPHELAPEVCSSRNAVSRQRSRTTRPLEPTRAGAPHGCSNRLALARRTAARTDSRWRAARPLEPTRAGAGAALARVLFGWHAVSLRFALAQARISWLTVSLRLALAPASSDAVARGRFTSAQRRFFSSATNRRVA